MKGREPSKAMISALQAVARMKPGSEIDPARWLELLTEARWVAGGKSPLLEDERGGSETRQ